jgi:hypothetical protein
MYDATYSSVDAGYKTYVSVFGNELLIMPVSQIVWPVAASAATSLAYGSLEAVVVSAQVSFKVQLLDAYENKLWFDQNAPVVDVSRFRCRPAYTQSLPLLYCPGGITSQDSHHKAHYILTDRVTYDKPAKLFTAGLTPRCRLYPPRARQCRTALRHLNRALCKFIYTCLESCSHWRRISL